MSRLAGSCGRLAFKFLKKQPNGFPKWWHHFTVPSATYEVLISPCPRQGEAILRVSSGTASRF